MRIYIKDGRLHTQTDYSYDFVCAAKQLNGKWDGNLKEWIFNAEDEEIVRKKLKEIYGEYGLGVVEKVRLEISLDHMDMKNRFYREIDLFGKVLIKRFSRDSIVRLHKDVLVKEGSFPPRGGSINNPALCPEKGTVLLVKNIPKDMAIAAQKNYGIEAIEIISTNEHDKNKLQAEKEQLLKRLDEINKLLKDKE